MNLQEKLERAKKVREEYYLINKLYLWSVFFLIAVAGVVVVIFYVGYDTCKNENQKQFVITQNGESVDVMNIGDPSLVENYCSYIGGFGDCFAEKEDLDISWLDRYAEVMWCKNYPNDCDYFKDIRNEGYNKWRIGDYYIQLK